MPPGNSGTFSTEVNILLGSSSVTFASEVPTGSSIVTSAFLSPFRFFWPGSATSSSFTVGGFSFTSTSGLTTGGGNLTWSTFGFGGSGGGGGGGFFKSTGGGESTTLVIFTFSFAFGINPAIMLMMVLADIAITNTATPIKRAVRVLRPLSFLSS